MSVYTYTDDTRIRRASPIPQQRYHETLHVRVGPTTDVRQSSGHEHVIATVLLSSARKRHSPPNCELPECRRTRYSRLAICTTDIGHNATFPKFLWSSQIQQLRSFVAPWVKRRRASAVRCNRLLEYIELTSPIQSHPVARFYRTTPRLDYRGVRGKTSPFLEPSESSSPPSPRAPSGRSRDRSIHRRS